MCMWKAMVLYAVTESMIWTNRAQNFALKILNIIGMEKNRRQTMGLRKFPIEWKRQWMEDLNWIVKGKCEELKGTWKNETLRNIEEIEMREREREIKLKIEREIRWVRKREVNQILRSFNLAKRKRER